jgi:endonuclease/exonuclease/phosphatase family metal-dependent hydrolase
MYLSLKLEICAELYVDRRIKKMKTLLNKTNTIVYLLLVLLFSFTNSFAQVKLVSWNIQNFGKSKSQGEINFIANTLKSYDIIALQEVVAGYGGAQAVAKLADELNRKGSKWDYVISDPTSSSAYKTERYAFIWKTANLKKIGRAWLEKKYHLEIDREPFYCTFEYKKNKFTVVNFHAITKSKQPETEIKYFKFLPGKYPSLNLIFAGDFNCPQSHTVFIPLKKMGYQSILVNQKTSLKQEVKKGKYLASEYDNMFYNTHKINTIDKVIISFYKNFGSLKEARMISDHIPIWFEFSLN